MLPMLFGYLARMYKTEAYSYTPAKKPPTADTALFRPDAILLIGRGRFGRIIEQPKYA